jgi:hypothetical protein
MHKVQKKFQSTNNESASKNTNTKLATGFISGANVSNDATDLYATAFKQII